MKHDQTPSPCSHRECVRDSLHDVRMYFRRWLSNLPDGSSVRASRVRKIGQALDSLDLAEATILDVMERITSEIHGTE